MIVSDGITVEVRLCAVLIVIVSREAKLKCGDFNRVNPSLFSSSSNFLGSKVHVNHLGHVHKIYIVHGVGSTQDVCITPLPSVHQSFKGIYGDPSVARF